MNNEDTATDPSGRASEMPPEQRTPRVYIVAGPNGAGKTTFAREFLPHYAQCPEFVNADLIAAGLSPFAPERAAFRAGRLMLEEIRRLAGSRRDFGFETTLSGKGHLALLRQLRELGYSLHLYFLWLQSVELALGRVADRVRQGGHDVPEAAVRRRFERSLHNFVQDYRRLMDSWMLFDNSAETPLLVARQEGGELKVFDRGMFARIQEETDEERTEKK